MTSEMIVKIAGGVYCAGVVLLASAVPFLEGFFKTKGMRPDWFYENTNTVYGDSLSVELFASIAFWPIAITAVIPWLVVSRSILALRRLGAWTARLRLPQKLKRAKAIEDEAVRSYRESPPTCPTCGRVK